MPRLAVSYEPEARRERAIRNALLVDKLLDIRGKRVLEIGCHIGDTTKVLAEDYDCEVVGIDIRRSDNWSQLNRHPRITVAEADVSKEHELFVENSFDRIVSFTVWEHIRHPFAALSTCQRVLKPNGKKFLYANLYRSAIASHLYRDIEEPWPHLMYSPDEIQEKFGLKTINAAFWVNKLTFQQYIYYFRCLGFFVTYQSFAQKFFDEEFYRANEQRLGLYPEWDLKTDFFQVVLQFDQEKPKQPIPDPVYRLR